MATLDAAAIELANSLLVEAVPAKLRCGSCNRLAVNAVKLPCCDQSICEPCSQDLPETCPICSHTPLSVDDCKPNKSLRMTIKAFIKSEEKKRSREAQASAPKPTPSQKESSAEAPVRDGSEAAEAGAESGAPLVPGNKPIIDASVVLPENFANRDAALSKQESREPSDHQRPASDSQSQAAEEEDDDDDDVIITTERAEEETQVIRPSDDPVDGSNERDQASEQFQTGGIQSFGYGPNQHQFGNMDFNPMNFNPMMAMQAGMGMGGFPMGMPNMLGMPGMDPSVMFGGGGGNGFGGMSMNDMNMMNMAMGMGGMGAFGGGMNGLNGPQAGIFPGPGGYNHQNFGNQMNQSFPNPGYSRPYGRGGYGRGRGGYGYNRGGRGGWQTHQNQHYGPNQYMNQQQHGFQGRVENAEGVALNGGRRGSPSYEPIISANNAGSVADDALQQPVVSVTNDTDGKVDDTATGSADVNGDLDRTQGEHSVPPAPLQSNYCLAAEPNEMSNFKDRTIDSEVNGDITKNDQTMHTVNTNGAQGSMSGEQQKGSQPQTGFDDRRGSGNAGRTGSIRGGRGNAAYGHVTTLGGPEPVQAAPPLNAPTGPKAMRAGLPNSGFYSRSQVQQQSSFAAQPHSHKETSTQAAPETQRHAVGSSDLGRSSRQEYRARSRTRSRSHSRHRSRRSREHSPGDGNDSDDGHGRRKHRNRHKRRSRSDKYNDESSVNGDQPESRARSRSVVPEDKHLSRQGAEPDSERYSSRSRRERSRERRKRRERDRERGRSRSPNGKSRDENRERARDERKREERRDRSKDRQKSRRDSSRTHDSSRRHSRASPSRDEAKSRGRDSDHQKKPILEQPEDEIGFKIKGGSKKHHNNNAVETEMAPPAAPRRRDRGDRRSSRADETSAVDAKESGDSYAMERQAREQARLERHRSQLAQTSNGRSGSLGKRVSRDDDDIEVPTGPRGYSDSAGAGGGSRRGKKARPMSYKYEDEIRENHDDRDSKRWR